MRKLLDDDGDDAGEAVGGAPTASAGEASPRAGASSAGASTLQASADEYATSESEGESGPSRLATHAEPQGGGLGKGFNPHIMSFDTLVKKLERRKSGWQRRPIDIDATIDSVMCPVQALTDHDPVIIEEDDQAPTDVPALNPGHVPEEFVCCKEISAPACPDKTFDLQMCPSSCQDEQATQMQEATDYTLDGSGPGSAGGAIEHVQEQSQAPACVGYDPLESTHMILGTGAGSGTGVRTTTIPTCESTDALADDVLPTQCITAPLRSMDAAIASACTSRPDGLKVDVQFSTGIFQEVQLSILKDKEDDMGHPEEHDAQKGGGTNGQAVPVQSENPDPTTDGIEANVSQPHSRTSSDALSEEQGHSEEGMEELEDSDASSVRDGAIDVDDEEAMLEAAIAQERHAQQFLRAKTQGTNRFCDGEAEQSEDEDISSDESDVENENGGLTTEEIADMVRELREKGLGEEKVATAHAQWLADEDDKMLKNLVRGVQRGFTKGRKRVEEDGEDWDVGGARERRWALMPQLENPAHRPQTRDEMISQYKRKLAALERSLESPIKPVTKVMNRRQEASTGPTAGDHVVLPEIADGDESPGARRWARLIAPESETSAVIPQTRPESQPWDAVVGIAGPSLIGRSKIFSDAINIKANSGGFMVCTLGATSSRNPAGVGERNEVTPSTVHGERHDANQATLSQLRQALGF
eukprot:jgi/Ulvmu1/12011/UM083_0024.1